MENKFSEVSMNGRMAYTIMCVEAYLVKKFPERDWTIIAREMWKATNEYWDDFYDSFCELIPEIFLTYDSYNDDLAKSISEEEFSVVKELYSGITEGLEDDPNDELNYMLNKPYEIAMVYEGTSIGDGKESFDIIENTEKVLSSNNVPLPDYSKVLFSSASEKNGWGNFFDGTHLSIILNK
ncbi:MAG: hypothetical protein HUK25_02570 [Treponema sp.]|nr:hypothetical protein [Treponema sp.]